MQKTMIKSLLAVAVAGTFATCASAAPLNGVNDWYTATATAPKYGAIDVNKLQENFTNINTELEAATATIAGIDTKINAAKGEANTYTDSKVGALDTKLTATAAGLQTQIAQNATNIAQNKKDIATNATNIATNTATIAAHYTEMKNNFAAVNSRIDKLDDKMKKGFASQAALNGLFQPYNVGKFNVSAAIGGYDSEQAMALGTGYRFNENFAIKAGVASDLGGFDHVTYNIGANFEF